MKSGIRITNSLLAVLVVLGAVIAIPAAPAQASALVINTLNDVDDGVCNVTHCSLREAINAANSIPSDDSITFSVSGTIHLGSSLPNINNYGTLTINGGDNITVSGDSDDNGSADVQIMTISTGATLTLQNITLTKGVNSIGIGGAIANYGHLTIQDSVISDSSAPGSGMGGGGVAISGGSSTLTVSGATFSGGSGQNEVIFGTV